MKKTFIAAFIIFSVAMMNLAMAFQDEPADFRGIKWGTIIADMSDMDPAKYPGKGDERFFVKKGDVLQIDNVEVGSIKYGFYKNRFFTAAIQYKTNADFKKLQESLEKKYGPVKKTNPLFDQYTWDGEKVRIENSYSSKTDAGHINYYYKPILKDKKQDNIEIEKKAKAKKGKGD
jgi:hypothetical protein